MVDVNLLSTKTEGDVIVVTVDVKFDKDSQNFLLAFNKSNKIVGFFLLPKPVTVSYSTPAYADTTLYKETETYVKAGAHNLVGILTVPKKSTNFPIVVLVHGSGPADMDETIGANKPFKDLAVGLAAKGIATIRYVKRTTLYPSEFGGAFTVKEEVLDDVIAAIALARMVPAVDKKQIYVLGHSLGGMLTPRLVALAPDLNGIILLAAPARNFTDVIIEQSKYMYDLSKDTTQAGKKELNDVTAEFQKIKTVKPGMMKPDSVLMGLPASYWADLNQYDQVDAAKKLTGQKIFIAQGGNDFQVSTQDFNLWNAALAKKKNVTLKLYPDLNHLFSTQTEKGTTRQYQTPANVSATLINDIATWINGK